MFAQKIFPLFAAYVVLAGCAEPQPPANPCKTPADCPANNNPCVEALCNFGACTTGPLDKGTVIAEQKPGDCGRLECDGNGKTMTTADDTDLPNDSNSCTTDLCNAGVAMNKPVLLGTACADNGGLVCDASGACVECNVPDDCSGMDTVCAFRACTAGVCGMGFAAAGVPTDMQTAGDCKVNVCDGAGGVMSTNDDLDVLDDGQACTADSCMNGTPQNVNLPLDTACSQNGGTVCNANGSCVECNDSAQCASGICSGAVCLPPKCDDGIRNGTESDIDCGGDTCLPCSAGDGCVSGADCYSGVCQGQACTGPVVTATSPADGAKNVSTKSDVAVIFSGAMVPTSLVGQIVPGPCSGSVQLSTDDFATCLAFASSAPTMSNNDTTATFTLAPALSYGSTYAVRVTTAAKGIDGSFLSAAYKSTMGFTTETPPNAMCTYNVVISEVYGGGGNTGAPYKNDFIELHNRGTAMVDLTGWSVQYASSAGSTWLVTPLTGSIAPGGYYLVQGASGANGAALPTPDATNMTNMSATAGKVILAKVATAFSGGCPVSADIVDLVGFGATTCFEGNAAAPAGSNTQSISRADSGCAESDDNAADFAVGAPTPKNKASAADACTCAVAGTLNESGTSAEIDYCTIQSPASINVAAMATTPAIVSQVLETGVTEAPGANASLVVQVGYGPTNINPTTQSGWTFFPTNYSMQVGSSDEYSGTFVAPMQMGTYRYAVRASLNGVAWTYCDLNGAGAIPGSTFEITQLPVLTVTP